MISKLEAENSVYREKPTLADKDDLAGIELSKQQNHLPNLVPR